MHWQWPNIKKSWYKVCSDQSPELSERLTLIHFFLPASYSMTLHHQCLVYEIILPYFYSLTPPELVGKNELLLHEVLGHRSLLVYVSSLLPIPCDVEQVLEPLKDWKDVLSRSFIGISGHFLILQITGILIVCLSTLTLHSSESPSLPRMPLSSVPPPTLTQQCAQDLGNLKA